MSPQETPPIANFMERHCASLARYGYDIILTSGSLVVWILETTIERDLCIIIMHEMKHGW